MLPAVGVVDGTGGRVVAVPWSNAGLSQVTSELTFAQTLGVLAKSTVRLVPSLGDVCSSTGLEARS